MEILAPVSSIDTLESAIQAGCDAIYCGMSEFGARAYAVNFTYDTLSQAVERCHSLGIKVYVTMNTLLKESEMERAYNQAKELHKIGVDALIVQDLGLIHLLHHRLPQLALHASTQLSVTRPSQIEELRKLGISRVVLARECTLEQIKECAKTGMEIEVFVHGALCICYSGQCLFSSLKYGRSGNRGQCAQPCRMPYTLSEDGKKINNIPPYLLSPKDLSLIEDVKKLEEAGAVSLKIEGRMKSAEYVYQSVSMVKKALNGQNLTKEDKEKLKVTYNRQYTRGHTFQQTGNNLMNINTPNHQGIFIGQAKMRSKDHAVVTLEQNVHINDGIRFVYKKEEFGFRLQGMYSMDHKPIQQATKGMTVYFKVPRAFSGTAKVLKTMDSELAKEVQNHMKKATRKLIVHCQLSCSGVGYPLECTLQSPLGSVSVTGKTIAVQSQNRPSDEETLKKQFSKTGNTFVQVGSFSFDIASNIYFSLSDMNALKHEAIEALYKKLTAREPIVENEYDVQLKEVDKEYAPIGMNVTNSYAIACLLELGYGGAVLSLECTDDAIEDLMKAFKERYGFTAPVSLFVYGHRRLMVMNHCIINTILGDGKRNHCGLCNKHKYTMQGKDGQSYIIQGTPTCKNEIYTKEIYDIRDKKSYYRSLGITHFVEAFA